MRRAFVNKSTKKALYPMVLSAALLPASLSANDADSWQFGLSIYGWFPDISGTTNFPLAPGDGDFTIGIGDILDNLSFTFQGTFDARKGNWGLVTDVIYLDVGKKNRNVQNGTIGNSDLPWEINGSLGLDMTSWLWTTAGYYRMVDDTNKSFDFLFGARYADVEQTLKWSLTGDIGETPIPGRDGRITVGDSYWDAVIGLRGNFAFGADNAWFIPYYADIGTGDSDLTWMLAAGLGYRFSWGEVAGAWRYLDYELPSGKAIQDMNFSGPALGMVFRW